jgi:hypothetical protein
MSAFRADTVIRSEGQVARDDKTAPQTHLGEHSDCESALANAFGRPGL